MVATPSPMQREGHIKEMQREGHIKEGDDSIARGILQRETVRIQREIDQLRANVRGGAQEQDPNSIGARASSSSSSI